MKNKILATLVALGIAGNVSAIEINENLSINGFIDGSYSHTETDGAADSQALGFDEAELNFITNVGNVDGVINIDSHNFDDLELEQAHITYSMDNGVSFTLGKYGSALGFEREDPTGLYTFSRAYGDIDNTVNANDNAFNFGHVDANAVEGITVAYAGDAFSIAASFENGFGNGVDTNIEDDELNLELSFAYTGIENVTIGGGYFFDNQANNADEVDALNLHVSTTMGKLFLAAEYSELDRDAAGDLDAWMVLADYDFNDKLGAALRISSNEKNGNSDYEKVTIAPNYAITDSLGAILEYSDVENGDTDSNELALEFLYTF